MFDSAFLAASLVILSAFLLPFCEPEETDASELRHRQRRSIGMTPAEGQDCVRWTAHARQSSANGVVYNYSKFHDCLAFCDGLPSCVAVDYDDASSPPCLIHTDPNDLLPENVHNKDTVTQYRINRGCPGPSCDPRWIRDSKRISGNGEHFLDAKTVDACLEVCEERPKCVAIDFDSTTASSFGCWLHLKPEDLLLNNLFQAPENVAQYIINRTCITPSSTVVPGCVTDWIFLDKSSGSGGVHYFQFRTVDDCKQLCLNLGTCFTIDFDTRLDLASGGCYVHNDPTRTTNHAQGLQQYRLKGSNCGPVSG